LYASSAAIYGDSSHFIESAEYESPLNVYGYSKFLFDNWARKTLPNATAQIVGFRYFNVYGPGENHKGSMASVAFHFNSQISETGKCQLFEGSDKILRDFVYIEDVIQANIKAASSGVSGVYNVGTGKARSFQDIADLLQENLGTNLGTNYIPNPFIGQYQFHTEANICATTADIGYEPAYELEDGIKAYIQEIKRLYKTEVK